MKLTYFARVAGAILLTAAALACSSDGGATDDGTSGTDGTAATDGTSGTDGTTGTTGVDGTDSTDGTPQACSQEIRPMGYIQSSGGDIVYQNNPLTMTARAKADGACTNRVEFAFQRGETAGCKLNLTFEEMQGVWMMTNGSFAGDAACGDFWPADDTQVFELDIENSVGALMNMPELVQGDSGLCGSGEDMHLVGNARFVAKGAGDEGQDRVLEMGLGTLGFKGTFLAEATESGSCPQEPRLCQGVECGQDFFSADCGSCNDGFTCAGGACVEGGCRALSTDKTVGYHIGEQTYTTSTGDAWALHSGCGETTAVWMIKTATWCSACYALRFEFQRLYNEYAHRGVKFVLLVGQDAQGAPATASEAAYYKSAYGYQDGWISVADPNWQKTEAVISSSYNAIPEHMILDKDMVLRSQSSASDFVFSQEAALLKILSEQGK